MRVLLAHNRYAQRGGEDAVFDQESALLRSHGHEVEEYLRDNRDIGRTSDARLALNTLWSSAAHDDAVRVMRELKPDVLHVHNTLPQISPAIYYAAATCKVPVVQTLHNYRLLCANGMLLRDGAVCEDCVGRRFGTPAIIHRCYRGSRLASFSVVSTIAFHRAIGTWRHKVSRYIALCEFARNKVLEAGLPPDRVVVKPNFSRDRHVGVDLDGPRAGALYLGRLSPEKGVDVLIDAWAGLAVPINVIGTGGLEARMRSTASSHVTIHGFLSDEEVTAAMRRASFLVMPSIVYEGFPMVVAETFSAGTPIVASRIGALAELIEDGVTGLHFEAGNPVDLAAKVRWAHEHPAEMAAMGRRARETYERKYTPAANYERLIEIYEEARATLQA